MFGFLRAYGIVFISPVGPIEPLFLRVTQGIPIFIMFSSPPGSDSELDIRPMSSQADLLDGQLQSLMFGRARFLHAELTGWPWYGVSCPPMDTYGIKSWGERGEICKIAHYAGLARFPL